MNELHIESSDELPKVQCLPPCGFVRLIDYMGNDLSIVRAARVSYNADWRTGDDEGKDEKLIKYMLENRHHSPFEAAVVTFEIQAPIFIFRQWHRHRTQSYNEVSARYTSLDMGYYIPEEECITTQDSKNKQARTSQVHPQAAQIREMINEGCQYTSHLYTKLLEMGCPRELARGVLPFNTVSRMFATANLRNWMHFLSLRDDPHAQWEIQQYAKAVALLLQPIYPVTMKYFAQYREV